MRNFDSKFFFTFLLHNTLVKYTFKIFSSDTLNKKKSSEDLIEKIELSRKNLKQKYYLITINIDKVNNDIFETKKLIKAVAAGPTKHIKFYSNE